MAIKFKADYKKLKELSVNELEFISTLIHEVAKGNIPLDMLKTQYDYSKLAYIAIAFEIDYKLDGVVKKEVIKDGK